MSAPPDVKAFVDPAPADVDTVVALSPLPVSVEKVERALAPLGRHRAAWLALRSGPAFWPWSVAIALIDRGWAVRSAVAWSPPAPPRAPPADRPARTVWNVFLLTRQPRYWYDMPGPQADKPVFRDRGDVWVGDVFDVVRFMVERACPPGGVVYDPWPVDATVGAAAVAAGRSVCLGPKGERVLPGVRRAALDARSVGRPSPPARVVLGERGGPRAARR